MIKPILFNTDMVRAILECRKTATRRVVKPRYCDSVFEMFKDGLCEASIDIPPRDNGDGTTTHFVRAYVPCKAPYRPGDTLYVRETWCPQFSDEHPFVYKASVENPAAWKWRPSIHMPREAARTLLRVTNVYPQQIKDVTEADARAEGFDSRDGFMTAILKMYHDCTEESWFWVNEFERINGEDADQVTSVKEE